MRAISDLPPPLTRVRSQLIEQIRGSVSASSPAEPGADGTWADLDPLRASPSNWDGREFLLRCLALAADGRHESARRCLRWWRAHDPLSTNWWHNQIGTPRLIAEVLLLGPEPDATLLELADRVLGRSGDFLLSSDGRTRQAKRWTGANQLWMCINRLYAAVLFERPDRLESIVADAMGEVRAAHRDEEGMQVDGGFHQHGPLLYNGGYGLAFLGDCCFFIAATQGTRWLPPETPRRLLIDHLLDGARWMLRGDRFCFSGADRNITRDQPHSALGFARIADILATGTKHRRDELLALAASIRSVRAPEPLRGCRMFHRSDFMVRHEPAACIAVRMHSRRTRSAESINGEGLRSHHLADGLTWLARTGREYDGIFPVWDWQRLPGVTACVTPVPEPPETVGTPTVADTVGGASDGECGVCAQHLINDALEIRKSWFFGPGATVCLGSGLSTHGSRKIVTALDQSLVQGPVCRDDDHTPLSFGRHGLNNVRRLRHGPWTFLFPSPVDLTVELGPRHGDWSHIGSGASGDVVRDVFLASIEHTTDNAPSGYAYVISTGDAPPSAPVIVGNSPSLQAVWWPDPARLQAVFHQPGQVVLPTGESLEVDQVCCVQLVRETDGRWRLDAADIRQLGGRLHATLRDGAGQILTSRAADAPEGDLAGLTFRLF